MNRKLIPVALVAATFAMSACAEKKLDEMTGKDAERLNCCRWATAR